MALTPEDVRNKQFSTAKRKGYEMDEVDSFLDQVELEIGALARENAELRGRVAAAEQAASAAIASAAATPPPPAPVPVAPVAPVAPAPVVQDHNEQAVAMLALAQRTAEEHKARARADADAMLADARAKVADLERTSQADRAALERRVEELRAFEREYRTRLRQHHESALKELEHRSGDTPVPVVAAAAAPSLPAAPVAPPVPAAPPVTPQLAPPAPTPMVAPPAPPAAPPVAPPSASPFAVPTEGTPPQQA